MNYAKINYYDIANGTGVRVSLFVSGCTHKCKNCFNSVAWDFNYGNEFTPEIENSIIDACNKDYISGISILGGEPFEPENQGAVLSLIKRFKETYPNKSVWCYSGCTYEQLAGLENSKYASKTTSEILNLIDILVDGEFIEELHNLSLGFRGSSNQRLIDTKATKQNNRVTLYEL